MQTLSERDQKVIWHPYSQHGLDHSLLPVESASGAYLTLSNGQKILDGISSWWVNLHGHCHPVIVSAIQKQAEKLEHVIFAGFTHEPATQLAECITQHPGIIEAKLNRVFFSDNGSTAVEVALKMAYQSFINQGITTRKRFIALSNSYHGDTLGAMAVGEPSGYHSIFRPLLPDVDFVESNDLNSLRQLVEASPNQYAAFIFEPLVQGAGGMRMYNPDFLKEASKLCKKNGILLIADEVFTGFFRTGKCFAIEHLSIRPDFLCLSKGITGGFLPLAVTLTTDSVYRSFLSNEMRTAFLHGHSYTANPLACAAAVASWKVLHSPETRTQVEAISRWTEFEISKLKDAPGLNNARCIGTIGAVDLKQQMTYFSSYREKILTFALENNVLLRPMGNVLYVVPPYCITQEELAHLYKVIRKLGEQKF